eukprot:scaffold456_cov390-Prasinococcus_capsulatus_cf.AAC.5
MGGGRVSCVAPHHVCQRSSLQTAVCGIHSYCTAEGSHERSLIAWGPRQSSCCALRDAGLHVWSSKPRIGREDRAVRSKQLTQLPRTVEVVEAVENFDGGLGAGLVGVPRAVQVHRVRNGERDAKLVVELVHLGRREHGDPVLDWAVPPQVVLAKVGAGLRLESLVTPADEEGGRGRRGDGHAGVPPCIVELGPDGVRVGALVNEECQAVLHVSLGDEERQHDPVAAHFLQEEATAGVLRKGWAVAGLDALDEVVDHWLELLVVLAANGAAEGTDLHLGYGGVIAVDVGRTGERRVRKHELLRSARRGEDRCQSRSSDNVTAGRLRRRVCRGLDGPCGTTSPNAPRTAGAKGDGGGDGALRS